MKFGWKEVAAWILPVSAAISCCMRATSEVDVEAMSARLVVSFKEWFVMNWARCGATTKQPLEFERGYSTPKWPDPPNA